MKKTVKRPLYFWGFALALLAATIFLSSGCNPSKPTPDPLAGFHIDPFHVADSYKTIKDDYQDYIKKLSLKERDFIGPVNLYVDGTGQHAVDIWVGMNGTWWRHILIYDKADKRINVIVSKAGGYRS